ncbi:MAG: alpha/beta hydrolase [bacterium]|nr:alpha/beta hydrolase [bacterium]
MISARLLVLALAILAPTQEATSRKQLLLWPDGAPGARGEEARDRPTLTVHLPEESDGPLPAVVICPGGGYKHLSAIDVYRRFFLAQGFAVFHLRYRLPTDGYLHPAPMHDVQRALRIVRHDAREWSVDPQRIGVMGFSSGGHVASTAATHFAAIEGSKGIDAASCRPDFAVLFCPVVSMLDHPHGPSVTRLLGKEPSAELLEALSNERQVTGRTPPTFLAHAKDDTLVPPQNSELFHAALRRHGVPSRLLLVDEGGHGFARKTQTWQAELGAWLRAGKWIDSSGVSR